MKLNQSINLPYFKFATQPGIEKITLTVTEVSKYFYESIIYKDFEVYYHIVHVSSSPFAILRHKTYLFPIKKTIFGI